MGMIRLHPGAKISLARLGMNELGVARAIASGELSSPQRYENMWLYAMRISGTGVSYRTRVGEFVHRDTENYLTKDFLDRCGGLPVIFKHPKTNMLDSKEYGERSVGAIMFAYIFLDEVWGIARIYDDEVVGLMQRKQMSTSPAVVFRKPVNIKVQLEDGSPLLVEGDPSLLDHLAICERGVWDKGGEPTGVLAHAIGDSVMPDEKEKVDTAAKGDTDMAMVDKVLKHFDEAVDKIKSHCDSIGSRMDSFDKFKKDWDEKEKADAAKADAAKSDAAKADAAKADGTKKDGEDDKDKEKSKEVVADKKKGDEDKDEKGDAAKKDAAKADATKADAKADDSGKLTADLIRRLTQVENLTRDMTDDDFKARAATQEKLDAVFNAFGDAAPRPLTGELPKSYRLRALGKIKQHSPQWKEIDLGELPDGVLTIAEEKIMADAQAAAMSPVDVADGTLREVTTRDRTTGRVVTNFYGKNTFIKEMSRPPRFVRTFNLPGSAAPAPPV